MSPPLSGGEGNISQCQMGKKYEKDENKKRGNVKDRKIGKKKGKSM
jgi:hypothetical protein